MKFSLPILPVKALAKSKSSFLQDSSKEYFLQVGIKAPVNVSNPGYYLSAICLNMSVISGVEHNLKSFAVASVFALTQSSPLFINFKPLFTSVAL